MRGVREVDAGDRVAVVAEVPEIGDLGVADDVGAALEGDGFAFVDRLIGAGVDDGRDGGDLDGERIGGGAAVAVVNGDGDGLLAGVGEDVADFASLGRFAIAEVPGVGQVVVACIRAGGR